MKLIDIIIYEYKHFVRNKAKLFAYILFLITCCYALNNGFRLQQKRLNTIQNLEKEKQKEISETLSFFDNGKKGPDDKPWIDVSKPIWAINMTPIYKIKEPNSCFPLGLGQAEQYAFYKKVNSWSTVFDKDMVEELANPERLLIGNIDFSFMVIFLLPILLIIFTYNILGLETDLDFDKLINIQSGNTKKWVATRMLFYFILLVLTVWALVLFVAFKNNAFEKFTSNILTLLAISFVYILIWAVLFYFIVLKTKGSRNSAFKMILLWLLFCVLIPGAVHQAASIKYPPNYMTDYLDAYRKEAYNLIDAKYDTLAAMMKNIYPELANTKHGKDKIINNEIINNTANAITNHLNSNAIKKIDAQLKSKNKLITSSYWFNPITMVQNKWNNVVGTDYNAYKLFRDEVQHSIDNKVKTLTIDYWENKTIDKQTYENYLKTLK